MLTDVEIAQGAKMEPITEVAKRAGIAEEDLELYGRYKAKISPDCYEKCKDQPDGKLILVTAINPTPAGEGKTTVTIGLGEALAKLGKKGMIALREPSLGPVFGIKGGAAGGGYSQVVPMEDINLHFTGDMHAITAANNLLSALIDNHMQQGNVLGVDQRRILFNRVLDMNDRALRNVIIGLGGKMSGIPREDHFTITVASEVMAILCLADSLEDLKTRLGNILVAYSYEGKPLFAKDFDAEGAMTVLLKDAVKPNLVQTLENTPALMHGGPFANIAHGCNSILATRLGLKLADYCVTEAGFGSDLGAEKFMDITAPAGGFVPDTVVIVATVKALKYNGGVAKNELSKENVDALKKGLVNLGAHIKNMQSYGVPVVVAINHFYTDTEEELEIMSEYVEQQGAACAVSDGFEKGGEGVIALAEKVLKACDEPNEYKVLYKAGIPIKEGIETIAKNIYGATGVEYSSAAEKAIREIEALGLKDLRVCMAKTQYSLSDDPAKLGRPTDFTLHITNVKVSAGAGFVVALCGDVMTMPGLPKHPAAMDIDILESGKITGLF